MPRSKVSVRGLGWFSLGLGTALVLAPRVGAARAMSRARRDQAPESDADVLRVAKAVTIRRQPEEVYRFWHGWLVERGAEITDDRPNELLAWHTLPGAEVQHGGRVTFSVAPGGRGTEVRVEMRYAPPGGRLGSTVARVFGQEPRQQVQADVRKLKQVLETGEVLRSPATLKGTHLFQRPAQPPQAQETRGARA